MLNNPIEPCLHCGACCANFRVSFYWAEANTLSIPDCMLEVITPVYTCLSGTNQPKPCCHALEGEIDYSVTCTMYAQRPSPCHELQIGDEKCQRARNKHGMPPLAFETMPASDTIASTVDE